MTPRNNGKKNIELYAFVVALILVFAYALFQAVSPQTSSVDTTELITAQSVTAVDGQGCIVRNETLLQTPVQGMIYPLVDDGEKVAVNSVVYRVYPDVDASQADAVREQLRVFDEALADLNEVSGSSSLSTLPALREEINRLYARYVQTAQTGNVSSLPTLQKQWLVLLNRMKKLTAGSNYSEQIALIEDAKQQLLSTCGTFVTGTSLSDRSGYYWSAETCDGYEAVLTPENLGTMTAAQLQEILADEKNDVGTDCAGKMVVGSIWYLALPVSASDAALLTAGKSYSVTCAGAAITVPMTLEYMTLAEEEALLVFSCNRQPEGFSYERLQDISVTVSSKTGYRIPLCAVTYYQDEWGVFILRGGTVYFRRIAAVATGTDFVLASVTDPNPEKETIYLASTDMLITYGKKLYDGKVVS